MDGLRKKKFQPWADLAACYGGGDVFRFPGAPEPDQECLFGLYLNRDRQETRRAYATLRAIRDAIGSDVMGKEYFHAAVDDPAEAEALYNLHVNRVQSARR